MTQSSKKIIKIYVRKEKHFQKCHRARKASHKLVGLKCGVWFWSTHNQLGTRWIGRLLSLFLEHPANFFVFFDKIAVSAPTLLDWWELGRWNGGNDWEGRWYQWVEEKYRCEHAQHPLSTFCICSQTFCMISFFSCDVYIVICHFHCHEHCKSNYSIYLSLSFSLAYWWCMRFPTKSVTENLKFGLFNL